MLKKILFISLLISCSGQDFSITQGSKSLRACIINGGVGEVEPFECEFGLCSYDVADKEDTICRIQTDNLYDAAQNPGFGFDILSVNKKPSCFVTGSQRVKVTPLEKTDDVLSILKTRNERYKALSYAVNVGIGAYFEVFNLELGIAGDKRTHTDTISASSMATYEYKKESRQLYDAIPTLKPEVKQLLLDGNKEEFRNRCGDQFARKVTVGGKLAIIFTARASTETSVSKTELQAALNVVSTINFGIDGKINFENQNLDNEIKIDASCVVRGGSTDICTKFKLNQTNISMQDTGFSEQVKLAKAELAKQLAAGNVVDIELEMEHYDVPKEMGVKDLWEVFVDYKPHRETLRIWSQMNADILSSCESYEHPGSVCEFAAEDIKEQINWCAKQKHWGSERCQEEGINSVHIAAVIQMARLEVITKSNTTVQLAVGGKESSRLVPEKVYNLDKNLLNGSDGANSISAATAKGWKLRFFKDRDAKGSSYDFSSSTDKKEAVTAPFNPRSFKLVK